MEQQTQPDTINITRIARGTRINADIESPGNIHIAGRVHGDIHTKQQVILEEDGRVTGTIICEQARLAGKLTGEIRATKHLILKNTAEVDGFVFTDKLEMEENAKLIGFIKAGPNVDVLNAKIEGHNKATANKDEGKTKSKKQVDKESSREKEESFQKSGKESEHSARITSIKAQNRHLAELLIGIPGDDVPAELTNKVFEQSENILNEMGFELEIFDKPSTSPYFQKLTYIKRSEKDEESVLQEFSDIKDVIESSFLKKEENQDDSPLQKAAINLTNAITELENVAIKMNQVLILKFKNGDVQTIAVEKVNDKITATVKKEPQKITDPETLYSLL